MKQLLAALALGALVAFWSHSAWAISVQADIPVAATLESKSNGVTTTTSNGTTSGGILGINFGWLGLQYEDVTLSKTTNGAKSSLDTTMYDLAINLPIPIINLAVGGGVGSGHLGGNAYTGLTTKDADMTEYFVQLGIPFAMLFDVHLSYRDLTGTNKVSGSSGGIPFSTKVAQDLQMYTLGIRIGW